MNMPIESETHLNSDVTFKGVVNFNKVMRIDGTFEGNINSEGKLYVNKTGKVKAEINVNDIEVEGIVDGNINAKGNIKLDSTAKIFGDLKAEKLKIDEGVVFVGKCDINPAKLDKKSF